MGCFCNSVDKTKESNKNENNNSIVAFKKCDNENYIECEYYIDENKDVEIINKTNEIDNQLKNHCTLKVNNKKINFTYTLYFNKSENKIRLDFRIYLNNIISFFSNCSYLNTIDLSHFLIDEIFDLSNLFLNCSNLKEINFSNLNTSKFKICKIYFQDVNH